MQGLLGVRGGDAAAPAFSQEAAKALRAGVQEDFELFEASDNEDPMEEGTANDSQGGKLTHLLASLSKSSSDVCILEKASSV